MEHAGPVQHSVVRSRAQPGKREMARDLRKVQTPAEARLWQSLRRNAVDGFHVRRQQVVEGYIVDFYCHAAALIIEVDGPVHAQQTEDDARRDAVLTARGFRILRVANEDVMDHLLNVLQTIRTAIAESRNERSVATE